MNAVCVADQKKKIMLCRQHKRIFHTIMNVDIFLKQLSRRTFHMSAQIRKNKTCCVDSVTS